MESVLYRAWSRDLKDGREGRTALHGERSIQGLDQRFTGWLRRLNCFGERSIQGLVQRFKGWLRRQNGFGERSIQGLDQRFKGWLRRQNGFAWRAFYTGPGPEI